MERNFTEWPLGSTDQGATLSIYRANQTRSNAVITVSYTHLTLPTKLEV